MATETTRYETHQKDSYNFSFGMIGGRKNKYNPGHGKPSKPGKPRKQREHSPQGGAGHNHHHNHSDDDDTDDHDNNNHHHGQSQPPQQGALQPAPGAYAYAYPAPYPYQCPPPPYPHQVAVGGGYHGDYHLQGYHHHMPHQGAYGSHGGRHMKDVGLVGAAIGVASFGMFKLLRERRRYGRG